MLLAFMSMEMTLFSAGTESCSDESRQRLLHLNVCLKKHGATAYSKYDGSTACDQQLRESWPLA